MTICVAGHFDLEAGEVEVGEHAVVGAARIIEWQLLEHQILLSKYPLVWIDLELERVFV